MSEINKPELVSTLKILFDLDAEAVKEVATLSKPTLEKIYQSYIVNAKEANHAAHKHFLATSGNKNSGSMEGRMGSLPERIISC